jgi:hypothetical protein
VTQATENAASARLGRIEDARRILIIGGSGSGKTTLAMALARRRGLPVFHLDPLADARGAASGSERSDEAVRSIAERDDWIAEGIHLGWTVPLIERADLIVWLDQVSDAESTVRVIRRFIRDGLAGVRDVRHPAGVLRLGPRIRHLRSLLTAMGEVRQYHRRPAEPGDPESTRDGRGPTRAATARALSGHVEKVLRIQDRRAYDLLLRGPDD